MAKITKSLSKRVDPHTGRVEILFRFVGSETLVLRAKSGIFINPKQWNEKRKELKSATFGEEEANTKRKLEALCTTILDDFTRVGKLDANKEWLATLIEKFHHPERFEVVVVKQPFFETFEEFLQVRKLSAVREKNFRVVMRTLQRFEIYTASTLDLDTATDATIREIEEFMVNEHELCKSKRYQSILKQIPTSRTPQPRGHNAMCSILTKIRTFWLWCIEEGKTTNRPKIEVKEEIYGTPYYITIEERKQIESADLSSRPSLAVQRDIFVFQCCIGCRVGDLYKMTPQNLVDGAIQYVPRKTKEGNPVTVTVPLNAVASEIIERYAENSTDKLLPYISEQKYNYAIKEIFELSGIDRVVQVRNPLTGESEPKPISEVASSHLARRTFVGNIYKQVKDPNLVGALSGHKEGSKAFARYRDIDNDMKVELVKLLE